MCMSFVLLCVYTYLCSYMCVHVLVLCCIGFVVCMYVRSSAEERPCRALELKSNQSINQSILGEIWGLARSQPIRSQQRSSSDSILIVEHRISPMISLACHYYL